MALDSSPRLLAVMIWYDRRPTAYQTRIGRFALYNLEDRLMNRVKEA